MKRKAGSYSWTSALAVAALALAACTKPDERTPGQKLDAALGKVEQKAEEAKVRAAEGASVAKERAREVLTDVRAAGSKAAHEAGGAVSDAVITSSVKAELARDPGLSALQIDVDSAGGRVALRGSAPDSAARARASTLAAAVKGVSSVDNQLVVAPK